MSKAKKVFSSILAGVTVGFANGFFGGGGGMIVVPVLTHFYKFEQKKAHATSIAIILPLTILSAVIYYFNNEVNLKELGSVSVGVLIGGIVGALLLKKINNKFLEYFFEAIMFGVGIRALFFT